jgi:hypothetical protein
MLQKYIKFTFMPRRQGGTALTILHFGARQARDGQRQGPADLHAGKNSSTYCRGQSRQCGCESRSTQLRRRENLSLSKVRTSGRPICRESLYRLCYPCSYRLQVSMHIHTYIHTHTHTHTYRICALFSILAAEKSGCVKYADFFFVEVLIWILF